MAEDVRDKNSKVLSWIKIISITGGAQAIVQATGLITGILLIRILPTKEYAYYTLANTMLATMTVLADGGISSGVMAQGGKSWKDKEQLGSVLATGLELRKKFAIFSLLVSLPILIYFLNHQGAGWGVILLSVLTLIPAFYAALSDSLLEIVPKLHQDIKPLQSNQIKVSLLRLTLSALSVYVFPFTFVALLANGIPRIYGNIQLRKISHKFADQQKGPDIEIRKQILKVVRKIMPGSIYYCISGQISVWLISYFGSTESVAQMGALGRFAMLLSVFSVLVSTLVIPRFARLGENKQILLSTFVKIQVGLILLCTAICFIVYLFPQQALWLLGKNYKGLETELVLSICASCLSFMSGILFGLSSSRGWPTNTLLLIPGNILFVITGACLFNVSTLKGVLYMNIFINIFPVLIHSVNFYHKIFKR